jgi:hypothetical protein
MPPGAIVRVSELMPVKDATRQRCILATTTTKWSHGFPSTEIEGESKFLFRRAPWVGRPAETSIAQKDPFRDPHRPSQSTPFDRSLFRERILKGHLPAPTPARKPCLKISTSALN